MRRLGLLTMLIAAGSLLLPSGTATAEDPKPPDLKEMHAAVQKLVLKHYPKAEVALKDDTIQFQFDTRKFMVHEQTLTGRWQDAFEEVGPQKGGIWGNLEFRPGRYMGMAAVPQSFDKRYYIQYVTATYAEKVDGHIYVHLRYPRGISADFLKDFQTLVNEFDKHVAR